MLDKYEVSVARFRSFVNAGQGTRINPPTLGSGAHANIPGSGWNLSWSSNLEPTTAELKTSLLCGDLPYATWTTEPGRNEDVPINCVTWFDAQAFCIWDGGYLPTEAEWHFAASGGSEQRAYPWSVPASALAVDCSRANYMSITAYCVPGFDGAVAAMNRVGSASPRGDGLWRHSDLGGNAWEWTLDWYGTYDIPCENCAALTIGTYRVIRGGNFSHGESSMRTADRGLVAPNSLPTSRTRDVGFRCARGM